MRQSNVVFRFRDYLKREQASLEKYLQKEVKNDRSAKVWDDKNLELASIYSELIEELEQEAANTLANREVLEVVDWVIENMITCNPEVSTLVVNLRLNDKNGYLSYLHFERYGSL